MSVAPGSPSVVTLGLLLFDAQCTAAFPGYSPRLFEESAEPPPRRRLVVVVVVYNSRRRRISFIRGFIRSAASAHFSLSDRFRQEINRPRTYRASVVSPTVSLSDFPFHSARPDAPSTLRGGRINNRHPWERWLVPDESLLARRLSLSLSVFLSSRFDKNQRPAASAVHVNQNIEPSIKTVDHRLRREPCPD